MRRTWKRSEGARRISRKVRLSSGWASKSVIDDLNSCMKVQLAKLKEEQEKSGKKIDHKENFKKVAADWKTAPENPKNKK